VTRRRWLLLLLGLIALLLGVARPAGAEEALTGRVVGVSDGDTIRVLVDRREVKVRLHGVDAPEAKQPFGSRAKQFTSERVFGKDVRVVVRDHDRYGRTVGVVSAAGKSLNADLVRAGMAWAYRRYSERYVGLEAEARRAKRGLWADAKPVPPWEFRASERTTRTVAAPRTTPEAPAAGVAVKAGTVIGNTASRVYHSPNCRSLPSLGRRKLFTSVTDAEKAGYHPHQACTR
jgi:micrococcal nuclease